MGWFVSRTGDEDTASLAVGGSIRRVVALVLVGVLPWTYLAVGDFQTVYFSFGWIDVGSTVVTPLTDYYFQYSAMRPRYLTAYGVGSGLYLLGTLSALLGLLEREDERVTAALVVLAGASQLWFAVGLLRRPGYLAVPIGTVLLWGFVWLYYRRAFRVLFVGGVARQ